MVRFMRSSCQLIRGWLVHALREGTAVITGSFAGATDKVTVDVYSTQNAPASYGLLLS